MKDLENAVKVTVVRLREQLQEIEGLHRFQFTIEAEGRVHDGEVKIEYSLREGIYDKVVQGGSLAPIVEEFLRRHGWQMRNQPLMLSFSEAPEAPADEIPF